MTFVEFLEAKWKRKPTPQEYSKFSNVIAWNIWQMDGLTGKIPKSNLKKGIQLELYRNIQTQERIEDRNCRIYDWRANKSIFFSNKKEVDNLLL